MGITARKSRRSLGSLSGYVPVPAVGNDDWLVPSESTRGMWETASEDSISSRQAGTR